MRAHATLALLLTALAGQVVGQDAEKVMDNPPGVPFKATLPKERFFKDADLMGNAKGSILAVATDSGNGVKFKVKFSNLPKEGGPFTYHLHAAPVPEDGNCTETLAHLDPYERGAETPCDAKDPASCEVGDLSGKHGKIDSDPFEAEYIDYYASTKEGIGAFFGNRSFVLHYANKTRLSCANFVSQIETPATNESYSAPHYLPTPTETINPTETPSSGPKTPSGSGTQEPEPSSSETGGATTPNAASTLALPVHLALAGVIALGLAL
ncbi:hypothetical protein BHE90_009479 [Fusarium euwallaceae]|uniref:superoxide dismutase n=1 Tax=Fusarium euwallaceae TaxID=1147111 RepID=A0A430LK13_9HYPO|nr:hypothetical protein BHE90_009479 [Fusarium euwallaceae]